MRLLRKDSNWKHILECANIAKESPCFRAKCGSIIIQDGQVIGKGFNGPPSNDKYDECKKDNLPDDFKGEKACCLHAEQRAILDALKTNPAKVEGAILFFSKVDDEGEPIPSGKPWCTICSKMAYDCGLKEFVLWHEDGITAYDTKEYNELSYEYRR